MKGLSWAAALIVFLAFFAVYSFRLGVQPALMHDDFEYTYPSFNLAENGNFGSPLLGTGLNINNRTYNLVVYYYASVHAVLIRIFGDGASSIALANTFHFALLAAAGAFFLARRHAFLGLAVFLFALTKDGRMIDAARHGRPEMTAACCLFIGVLALWVWYGEGRRQPLVLFGMSAALTAGMFSHTSVAFFGAALLLAFLVPRMRQARPRELLAALLPFAIVPLLYAYFILTDSVANIRGQLAPVRGDLLLASRVKLALQGQWTELATLTIEFVRTHLWTPVPWLGAAAGLVAPALFASSWSRGARFFAQTYCLFLVVHYLLLKHFVVSYQVIYLAELYMALAFLAEGIVARLGELWPRPAWIAAARTAGIAVLTVLTVRSQVLFRSNLYGQRPPFARLQGALTSALLEAGARPGDRVFVPSPFGFQLRKTFDVVAHPAPKYYMGHWSPAFRQRVREVWGEDVLAQVNARPLCWAMGLAFLRPRWVMAWNADYSVMHWYWIFLRRFPELPGVQLTPSGETPLPPPYGGTVAVYRLTLSDPIDALDRTPQSADAPCP